MRRNIPSPQREINDLEPPACFYYALKPVNLTVPQQPLFIKEGDKIGIEIGNPFLIDYLRHELKELHHITDGSFSPELVKLTKDAYIDLFEKFLPKDSKKKIKEALISAGAEPDKSFKGVMLGVLGKLGSKVADEAGSEAAKSIVKYLGPVLEGSVSKIKDTFTELYKD